MKLLSSALAVQKARANATKKILNAVENALHQAIDEFEGTSVQVDLSQMLERQLPETVEEVRAEVERASADAKWECRWEDEFIVILTPQ